MSGGLYSTRGTDRAVTLTNIRKLRFFAGFVKVFATISTILFIRAPRSFVIPVSGPNRALQHNQHPIHGLSQTGGAASACKGNPAGAEQIRQINVVFLRYNRNRGASMKIDRLIGIITILLQREKTTVSQLAQRFEVSCRTIQRDVDAICKAGIPVVSMQGYGGGLSLADGYKLDKTVLTEKELLAILAGVRSIDSVSKNNCGQTLIEKFSSGKTILTEQNSILINLASWYQSSLPDKIERIRLAIRNRENIAFVYYSEKGESERTIEPYRILFQWSAWYVYGYCSAQGDFRLFRFNRLWELRNTSTFFEPRPLPDEKTAFENYFQTETVELTALFDVRAKYRLIEEYGPDCFTVFESGGLLFRRSFSSVSYVTRWLFSFGDQVKVLAPSFLITTLREQAENMVRQYT